jgi:hypothetical protein
LTHARRSDKTDLVKGASVYLAGLLVVLAARTAAAEPAVGAAPPAPPGASSDTPAAPAGTPPGSAPPPSTLTVPPPQPPATITVGMPQPSVRPINRDIGVGVALTYVSIPLVFISGGVLAVGYLVDSNGAKITGWVMTGSSLALFGVGVAFLVSGSQSGPQPQQAASSGTTVRSGAPDRAERRELAPAGATFAIPVISGSF